MMPSPLLGDIDIDKSITRCAQSIFKVCLGTPNGAVLKQTTGYEPVNLTSDSSEHNSMDNLSREEKDVLTVVLNALRRIDIGNGEVMKVTVGGEKPNVILSYPRPAPTPKAVAEFIRSTKVKPRPTRTTGAVHYNPVEEVTSTSKKMRKQAVSNVIAKMSKVHDWPARNAPANPVYLPDTALDNYDPNKYDCYRTLVITGVSNTHANSWKFMAPDVLAVTMDFADIHQMAGMAEEIVSSLGIRFQNVILVESTFTTAKLAKLNNDPNALMEAMKNAVTDATRNLKKDGKRRVLVFAPPGINNKSCKESTVELWRGVCGVTSSRESVQFVGPQFESAFGRINDYATELFIYLMQERFNSHFRNDELTLLLDPVRAVNNYDLCTSVIKSGSCSEVAMKGETKRLLSLNLPTGMCAATPDAARFARFDGREDLLTETIQSVDLRSFTFSNTPENNDLELKVGGNGDLLSDDEGEVAEIVKYFRELLKEMIDDFKLTDIADIQTFMETTLCDFGGFCGKNDSRMDVMGMFPAIWRNFLKSKNEFSIPDFEVTVQATEMREAVWLLPIEALLAMIILCGTETFSNGPVACLIEILRLKDILEVHLMRPLDVTIEEMEEEARKRVDRLLAAMLICPDLTSICKVFNIKSKADSLNWYGTLYLVQRLKRASGGSVGTKTIWTQNGDVVADVYDLPTIPAVATRMRTTIPALMRSFPLVCGYFYSEMSSEFQLNAKEMLFTGKFSGPSVLLPQFVKRVKDENWSRITKPLVPISTQRLAAMQTLCSSIDPKAGRTAMDVPLCTFKPSVVIADLTNSSADSTGKSKLQVYQLLFQGIKRNTTPNRRPVSVSEDMDDENATPPQAPSAKLSDQYTPVSTASTDSLKPSTSKGFGVQSVARPPGFDSNESSTGLALFKQSLNNNESGTHSPGKRQGSPASSDNSGRARDESLRESKVARVNAKARLGKANDEQEESDDGWAAAKKTFRDRSVVSKNEPAPKVQGGRGKASVGKEESSKNTEKSFADTVKGPAKPNVSQQIKSKVVVANPEQHNQQNKKSTKTNEKNQSATEQSPASKGKSQRKKQPKKGTGNSGNPTGDVQSAAATTSGAKANQTNDDRNKGGRPKLPPEEAAKRQKERNKARNQAKREKNRLKRQADREKDSDAEDSDTSPAKESYPVNAHVWGVSNQAWLRNAVNRQEAKDHPVLPIITVESEVRFEEPTMQAMLPRSQTADIEEPFHTLISPMTYSVADQVNLPRSAYDFDETLLRGEKVRSAPSKPPSKYLAVEKTEIPWAFRDSTTYPTIPREFDDVDKFSQYVKDCGKAARIRLPPVDLSEDQVAVQWAVLGFLLVMRLEDSKAILPSFLERCREYGLVNGEIKESVKEWILQSVPTDALRVVDPTRLYQVMTTIRLTPVIIDFLQDDYKPSLEDMREVFVFKTTLEGVERSEEQFKKHDPGLHDYLTRATKTTVNIGRGMSTAIGDGPEVQLWSLEVSRYWATYWDSKILETERWFNSNETSYVETLKAPESRVKIGLLDGTSWSTYSMSDLQLICAPPVSIDGMVIANPDYTRCMFMTSNEAPVTVLEYLMKVGKTPEAPTKTPVCAKCFVESCECELKWQFYLSAEALLEVDELKWCQKVIQDENGQPRCAENFDNVVQLYSTFIDPGILAEWLDNDVEQMRFIGMSVSGVSQLFRKLVTEYARRMCPDLRQRMERDLKHSIPNSRDAVFFDHVSKVIATDVSGANLYHEYHQAPRPMAACLISSQAKRRLEDAIAVLNKDDASDYIRESLEDCRGPLGGLIMRRQPAGPDKNDPPVLTVNANKNDGRTIVSMRNAMLTVAELSAPWILQGNQNIAFEKRAKRAQYPRCFGFARTAYGTKKQNICFVFSTKNIELLGHPNPERTAIICLGDHFLVKTLMKYPASFENGNAPSIAKIQDAVQSPVSYDIFMVHAALHRLNPLEYALASTNAMSAEFENLALREIFYFITSWANAHEFRAPMIAPSDPELLRQLVAKFYNKTLVGRSRQSCELGEHDEARSCCNYYMYRKNFFITLHRMFCVPMRCGDSPDIKSRKWWKLVAKELKWDEHVIPCYCNRKAAMVVDDALNRLEGGAINQPIERKRDFYAPQGPVGVDDGNEPVESDADDEVPESVHQAADVQAGRTEESMELENNLASVMRMSLPPGSTTTMVRGIEVLERPPHGIEVAADEIPEVAAHVDVQNMDTTNPAEITTSESTDITTTNSSEVEVTPPDEETSEEVTTGTSAETAMVVDFNNNSSEDEEPSDAETVKDAAEVDRALRVVPDEDEDRPDNVLTGSAIAIAVSAPVGASVDVLVQDIQMDYVEDMDH